MLIIQLVIRLFVIVGICHCKIANYHVSYWVLLTDVCSSGSLVARLSGQVKTEMGRKDDV